MWLLHLPEDVLILILKKLDTISLYNLYTISDRIRNIIIAYRISTICDFSLSVLGTAQSLNLNFFKDIARHLYVLNVSGITTLRKTAILPAMKRLKNLKILNIAYTSIDLHDFVELYSACPTIVNISMNFTFHNAKRRGMPKLLELQDVFKNMKNVQFVGNLTTLFYSKLPFFILSKSVLEKLQYTVLECKKGDFHNHSNNYEITIQVQQLQICILDENKSDKNYGFMYEMLLFQTLEFDDYEVIVIVSSSTTENSLFITPAFEHFFKTYYNCNLFGISSYSVCLVGNVVVKLWNKSMTVFDENFFESLRENLRPYFQCRVVSEEKRPTPLNYDSYFSNLMRTATLNIAEPLFKKPRIAEQPVKMDYSKQFEHHEKVQLTVTFRSDVRSVSINKSYDYLQKLTYLCLFGQVRYSVDFFKILFSCCVNLTTLSINNPPISACVTLISKSISLSNSIKNLRIVDNKIDFKLLFSYLSQCKSLENVNICDVSDSFELSDPSVFFKNCPKLYCLYIFGHGSNGILNKKLQILKNARKKCNKLHIRINVFENTSSLYDPCMSVFKLNTMQP